jgi:virginiamycin A acetyltransferase
MINLNKKLRFLFGKLAFRKSSAYPNIINSIVSHPHMISNQSRIENSALSGEIHFAEKSYVENGKINGKVQIGRYTSINGPNTDIYALKTHVKIGNFCSIARNVSIQEYNHILQRCSSYFIMHHVFNEDFLNEIESKGPIIIGNDVWIGTQSVVLTGVTIGDGAVIAANSVVNTDIPPYAIAAGTPAKVVGYRFSDELINELLRIQWWDWPLSKIIRNKVLFEGHLSIDKIHAIQN